MSLTIEEPATYDAYVGFIQGFQARVPLRAEYSNNTEKGREGIRRFVAFAANRTVVGWMTLKTQPSDLKIEGICADPDKTFGKGVAKELIVKAANCSFAAGKGGALTLFNASNGTGNALYEAIGFRYVDKASGAMRLEMNYGRQYAESSTDPKAERVLEWVVSEGPSATTSRGKTLPTAVHSVRERMVKPG